MHSAGLAMYRKRGEKIEVLLVHPGGPFWAKKDEGVWSIPKGEVDPGENGLDAAKREFKEELGFAAEGEFVSLGSVKQKSGKIVQAWALEGDCDPASIRSNTFEMEWPPRSGKNQFFPEIDKAAFFDTGIAMRKIIPEQVKFIEAIRNAVA